MSSIEENAGVEWAKKLIDFTFNSGVNCCVIIPTRQGNGAGQKLQNDGYFTPPNIASLEKILEYGNSLSTGNVFGDLWDIRKCSNYNKYLDSKLNRINTMNTTPKIIEWVECDCEMTLNKQ